TLRTQGHWPLTFSLAMIGLTTSCSGAIGGSAPSGPGPAPSPTPPGGSVHGDVGTVAIRQLTIAEYNNTVHDLLGTALHPADTFGTSEADGFDTIASAGVINSRKVSDYFDAATSLAEDAFASDALRGRIVTCQSASPSDTACAESIIKAFGLRAFRRPLETAETAEFVSQYQKALVQTADHAQAIKQVVRIMLVAPQFIYRIELDPDPSSMTVHALNSYEVASRLSYTIWSSMPDDQLLAAAGTNELLTPPGVQAQVDRLLADPRSSALVDNFAGQWLGMRRLKDHVVDTTVYPFWTDALKSSMQQEMGRYFDDFLHGTLTYDQFLTADFNYVDANLAPVYGVPAPAGQGMVRIENTTDHRVGFLGLAGLLTFTSRPERSAPSIRGQLVLDALRCIKLELPPNFTPPPLAEPMPGQTVRQQVEAHGSMPACAPCHSLLDPVGLSLEHFDGSGRYRETYAGGLPIDASGVFPGGKPFDGLEGLAATIASDPSFVSCAAQKLFTFGIGRPIDAGDPSAPYLSQIVDGWRANGLTLRNLVKQLATNDTFRFRRGQP
ncbi:MAG: hypothetical protein QOI66_1419, partial [Myxococcales bacterium]|nr:hypothetical protein [Myxococcales bacterium]